MDFEILNFIQTHLRAPFLDDFFSRITHLGDAGTIWILIAVFLSFTKKYRKAGVGMLIAMLVTYILGDHIIKPLAGRARPFTHRDIELLIRLRASILSRPVTRLLLSVPPYTCFYTTKSWESQLLSWQH